MSLRKARDRAGRDVYLETIVSRFFEENGIEWRLSEKGWQKYLEMVKQKTD